MNGNKAQSGITANPFVYPGEPRGIHRLSFRSEAGAIVFGFFGNTRLATTLVAVTRLANPRYLLEVEVTVVAAAA